MSAKKKPSKNPVGPRAGRNAEALDAHEAAALLNAHVETVRRLARRGDIPSFKVGKDWRFKREALVRWSESSRKKTAQSSEQQRPGDAAPAASTARTQGGAFPIVGPVGEMIGQRAPGFGYRRARAAIRAAT